MTTTTQTVSAEAQDRMRDIVARHCQYHGPCSLSPAAEQRVKAGEATAEDIRAYLHWWSIPWTDLRVVAEAALRDGVPVGRARALCNECGRQRLVSWRSGRQVTLACGTCRARTVHSCLPDNDPHALIRARDVDAEQVGSRIIEEETARLWALGVSVREIESKSVFAPCASLCHDIEKTGAYFVRYNSREKRASVAAKLGVIRLVIEAGVPPFVQWRDSGGIRTALL